MSYALEGKLNKQIAQELSISVSQVGLIWRSIRCKTNTQNRAEAIHSYANWRKRQTESAENLLRMSAIALGIDGESEGSESILAPTPELLDALSIGIFAIEEDFHFIIYANSEASYRLGIQGRSFPLSTSEVAHFEGVRSQFLRSRASISEVTFPAGTIRVERQGHFWVCTLFPEFSLVQHSKLETLRRDAEIYTKNLTRLPNQFQLEQKVGTDLIENVGRFFGADYAAWYSVDGQATNPVRRFHYTPDYFMELDIVSHSTSATGSVWVPRLSRERFVLFHDLFAAKLVRCPLLAKLRANGLRCAQAFAIGRDSNFTGFILLGYSSQIALPLHQCDAAELDLFTGILAGLPSGLETSAFVVDPELGSVNVNVEPTD